MVMPERKDIIIPPFKSAETNKEVDTGELKHKIFEYLGSEITEREMCIRDSIYTNRDLFIARYAVGIIYTYFIGTHI